MENPKGLPKQKYRIQYIMDNDLDHYGHATDYCNYFEVEVLTRSQAPGELFSIVGKASFAKFLLTKALKDKYDLLDFFDMNTMSYEFGKFLFDFDTHKVVPEAFEIFNSKEGHDILYLDSLELLPEVRGTGLGHFIIKDVYARFSSGCQMMILKARPSKLISEYDAWGKELELDQLSEDTEIGKYKLYAYCQKLGFKNSFNNELFFIDPTEKNEQMGMSSLEKLLT